MGQRNPYKTEVGGTPPGLIKCLINSRRRIGRNNEHLSESFIACKSLSPAFSHLIFTAGLGGRYYHYLHFIGEERKAVTPPSLGGQAGRQAVHAPQGGVSGSVMKAVRTNFSPDCAGSQSEYRLRLVLVITMGGRSAGVMALPKRSLSETVRARWPFQSSDPHWPLSCLFLWQLPSVHCEKRAGINQHHHTWQWENQLWWESLIS